MIVTSIIIAHVDDGSKKLLDGQREQRAFGETVYEEFILNVHFIISKLY